MRMVSARRSIALISFALLQVNDAHSSCFLCSLFSGLVLDLVGAISGGGENATHNAQRRSIDAASSRKQRGRSSLFILFVST